MSAVLASRLDPGAIIVIKGNKLLSLRYSRKHQAVLYASEPEYIDWGLQIGDCGFEDMAEVRSSHAHNSHSKNPHSEIQNPKSSGWRELEIPQGKSLCSVFEIFCIHGGKIDCGGRICDFGFKETIKIGVKNA